MSGASTGPSGPGPGPSPKQYKYGLTESDSADGQIQLYKSMLLSYNPTSGNGLAPPYNLDPVNNCIMWISLDDIISTRPNDSSDLSGTNSFASKFSGKPPTSLPMFVYKTKRDILIYNKDSRSVVLPKGSAYNLRTPPITFSGQAGGGAPTKPYTETLSDFIDRATIVAAGVSPKYKLFDGLISSLGYPVYVTKLDSTNIIWIPQNPMKPLSDTGWIFNAPITNIAAPDSVILYKMANSIDASRYGYLHNKDMGPELKSAVISASNRLTDANAALQTMNKTITDLSAQYLVAQTDLSNESAAITDALLDIKGYTTFLHDAFTVIYEYNPTAKTYRAVDYEVKYAKELAAYKVQLANQKTAYQTYLAAYATQHPSHNYAIPNLSSATGFAAYQLQYNAQNEIIHKGLDAYLDYTKAKASADLAQYNYDNYVYSKRADAVSAIATLLADIQKSPYAAYGFNDGSLRTLVANTTCPKLNLSDIMKYDVTYGNKLITNMDEYVLGNFATDMRGEAATLLNQFCQMQSTVSDISGQYTRMLEGMVKVFQWYIGGNPQSNLQPSDVTVYYRIKNEIPYANLDDTYILLYELISKNRPFSDTYYQRQSWIFTNINHSTQQGRDYYKWDSKYGGLTGTMWTDMMAILTNLYNAYTTAVNAAQTKWAQYQAVLNDMNTVTSLVKNVGNPVSLYMSLKIAGYNKVAGKVQNTQSLDTILQSIEFFTKRSSYANKYLQDALKDVKDASHVASVTSLIGNVYSTVLPQLHSAALSIDASGTLAHFSKLYGINKPVAGPTGPSGPSGPSGPKASSGPKGPADALSQALTVAATAREATGPTIDEQYNALDTIIRIITNTESQAFSDASGATPMTPPKGDVSKRFWTPAGIRSIYTQLSPIMDSTVTNAEAVLNAPISNVPALSTLEINAVNMDISGIRSAYLSISGENTTINTLYTKVTTAIQAYNNYLNAVLSTYKLPPRSDMITELSTLVSNQAITRANNRKKSWENVNQYYNVPADFKRVILSLINGSDIDILFNNYASISGVGTSGFTRKNDDYSPIDLFKLQSKYKIIIDTIAPLQASILAIKGQLDKEAGMDVPVDFYKAAILTRETTPSGHTTLYRLFYKTLCARQDLQLAKMQFAFYLTPAGQQYRQYMNMQSTVNRLRIYNAASYNLNKQMPLLTPAITANTTPYYSIQIPSPIISMDGNTHIAGKLFSEMNAAYITSLSKDNAYSLFTLIAGIISKLKSTITQSYKPIISYAYSPPLALNSYTPCIGKINIYNTTDSFTKYYGLTNTSALDYYATKQVMHDTTITNNNITAMKAIASRVDINLQLQDDTRTSYQRWRLDNQGYIVDNSGEPSQFIHSTLSHKYQNPLVQVYTFGANTIFNLASLYDIAKMSAPVAPPPAYAPFGEPGRAPYEDITVRYREGGTGLDDTIEYWYPDSQKARMGGKYGALQDGSYSQIIPAEYTIATTVAPWIDNPVSIDVSDGLIHRPASYRPIWMKQISVIDATYFSILARDIPRFATNAQYKTYIQQYLQEDSKQSKWAPIHTSNNIRVLDKSVAKGVPPAWWKLLELKYRTWYYLNKGFTSGIKQTARDRLYSSLKLNVLIVPNLKKNILDASGALIQCNKNLVDPSMQRRFMFFKLDAATEHDRTAPETVANIKAGVISPILNFYSRGVAYSPSLPAYELDYYAAEFVFRAYVQASNNGVKPSAMVAAAKAATISLNVADQTVLPDAFMNSLRAAEQSPTKVEAPPIDTYNIQLNYYLTADGGDTDAIPVQPAVGVSSNTFTTFIVINGVLGGPTYAQSDTFDGPDGNYMNTSGRVLVNSSLLKYDTTLSRFVLSSAPDMDVVINEVLVFDRALSSIEKDNIVSYLSYKWVCMQYMPINSRFFPDNYRSNYDADMMEMRQSIYKSIYNVLDPIVTSLNATSYTKATNTGNMLQYFIESTKVTNQYIGQYKNDIINQAYSFRDSGLMNTIQRYRQLFRYLTKAAITYIPPTQLATIPTVNPESNLEIVTLKAAVNALKDMMKLVEANEVKSKYIGKGPTYINMIDLSDVPTYIINSQYSSVKNLLRIGAHDGATLLNPDNMIDYFSPVIDKKGTVTRLYPGPSTEFLYFKDIMTLDGAAVYYKYLLDKAYNQVYTAEKDRQMAQYTKMLDSVTSIVKPSFKKHLDDICAQENKNSSKYIYEERAALDTATGKMNGMLTSLWTLPDNFARLAVELEEKAEAAKQASLVAAKNAVRNEIILGAATQTTARLQTVTSQLSRSRADVQMLVDLAAKNNVVVYQDLSASLLGQLLSDYNEIMSQSAASNMSDLLYNINQVNAAAGYDASQVYFMSNLRIIGGIAHDANSNRLPRQPTAQEFLYHDAVKSIDMITLTVLQALIKKYVKIFTTITKGLSDQTFPLYNIQLYTYYLTNYLADIRFISDTILNTVNAMTPKIKTLLQMVPGALDPARFRGVIAEVVKVINHIRGVPSGPMTGGGSGPAPTLAETCAKTISDLKTILQNPFTTQDPMGAISAMLPRFDLTEPSDLYPVDFYMIANSIGGFVQPDPSQPLQAALRDISNANTSIAQYTSLIKPNITSLKFPPNVKDILETSASNMISVLAIDINNVSESINSILWRNNIDVQWPTGFLDKYTTALNDISGLNAQLTTSGYYSQKQFSAAINTLPKSDIVQKYIKMRYIKQLNRTQRQALGIPYILVDSSGNPADANGITLGPKDIYIPIDPYVELLTLSQDGAYFYYDYNDDSVKEDIAQLATLQSQLTAATASLNSSQNDALTPYEKRSSELAQAGQMYYQVRDKYSYLPAAPSDYVAQLISQRTAVQASLQAQVNAQIAKIGARTYNDALNVRYYLKGAFTVNLNPRLFPRLLFRPIVDVIIPSNSDLSGHIMMDINNKNCILSINAGMYFQGIELPRRGLDAGDYYIISNSTLFPLFVHVPNTASTIRTMIPPGGVAQYSYSLSQGTSFYGYMPMTTNALPDVFRGVPRTKVAATVTEWGKTVFIDYVPQFTDYSISPTQDASGFAIDLIVERDSTGSYVYYDQDDVNKFNPIPVKYLGAMNLSAMSGTALPPRARTLSVYYLSHSSSLNILCDAKGNVAFDVNGDMKTVPGPLYASATTAYYQDLPTATVNPTPLGTYTGFTSFSPSVSTAYLYRSPFCVRWINVTGPYVFCNPQGHILLEESNTPILLPGLSQRPTGEQISAMVSQNVRATYYESAPMTGPSGAVNAPSPNYCIILQNDRVRDNSDIISVTPVINKAPFAQQLVDFDALRLAREKLDTNATLYNRFKNVISGLTTLKATYSSSGFTSGASTTFSDIQATAPALYQQLQNGVASLNTTYTQLSADIPVVEQLNLQGGDVFQQLTMYAEKAENALKDLVSSVSFSRIMATYAFYKTSLIDANQVVANISDAIVQIRGIRAPLAAKVTSLLNAQTYLTTDDLPLYTAKILAPIDTRLSDISSNAQILPTLISNMKTATTNAEINQYMHSIYSAGSIASNYLTVTKGYMSISGDVIDSLKVDLVSRISVLVNVRHTTMLKAFDLSDTIVDPSIQTFNPAAYTALQGFKTTIQGLKGRLPTAATVQALAQQFVARDLDATVASYTAYMAASKSAFDVLNGIGVAQAQMAALYAKTVPEILTNIKEPVYNLITNILSPIQTITGCQASVQALITKYNLATNTPTLYTAEQAASIIAMKAALDQGYTGLNTYSADLTKLGAIQAMFDSSGTPVLSDIFTYYGLQPTPRATTLTNAVKTVAMSAADLNRYVSTVQADSTSALISNLTKTINAALNEKTQFDALVPYMKNMITVLGTSTWRKQFLPFINQLHFTKLYASYITSVLKPLVLIDTGSNADVLLPTFASLQTNEAIYTKLLDLLYSTINIIYTKVSTYTVPRIIASITPMPTRKPLTDQPTSVINDISGGINTAALPPSYHYGTVDKVFVAYMNYYTWIQAYKPVLDAVLANAYSNEVPIIYAIYDLCDTIGAQFETAITTNNGVSTELFMGNYAGLQTMTANINTSTCSLYSLLWKRISAILQYNKIPTATITTMLTNILNLQGATQGPVIQYYTLIGGLNIDNATALAAAINALPTIHNAVVALKINVPSATLTANQARVAKSLTTVPAAPVGKTFMGETTLEHKIHWLFTVPNANIRVMCLKAVMFDIFKYKVRFTPMFDSISLATDFLIPNLFNGGRVFDFFDSMDMAADKPDLPTTIVKSLAGLLPNDQPTFTNNADVSIYTTIDLYTKLLTASDKSGLNAFFSGIDSIANFTTNNADSIMLSITDAYVPSLAPPPPPPPPPLTIDTFQKAVAYNSITHVAGMQNNNEFAQQYMYFYTTAVKYMAPVDATTSALNQVVKYQDTKHIWPSFTAFAKEYMGYITDGIQYMSPVDAIQGAWDQIRANNMDGGGAPTVSVSIPFQYVDDGKSSYTSMSALLTALYSEYLTESSKTPPNLYSVQLIVDSYHMAYMQIYYTATPSAAETANHTMLTTGVGGQPVYSMYTDANKYNLTYLPGIPDTFIIPIPSGDYNKANMNYWIYFINTIYTTANALLNTIEAKGATDKAAYSAKVAADPARGKSGASSAALEATTRATDRTKAVALLRTPPIATDI